MHFENALNASIYAVSRAFFTQFLAKFRILSISNSQPSVNDKIILI